MQIPKKKGLIRLIIFGFYLRMPYIQVMAAVNAL